MDSTESDLATAYSADQHTPRPEGNHSDGNGPLPGKKPLVEEARVYDARPRSQPRDYRRGNARHSGYKKEDTYKSEHSKKHLEHRLEKRGGSLPDDERRGELEEGMEGLVEGLEVGGSRLHSGGSPSGRSKPHPQSHPQPRPHRQYHSAAGYGKYHEKHRQSKAATKREYETCSSSDVKGKSPKSGHDHVSRKEHEQETREAGDRDESGGGASGDETRREREKGDGGNRRREYRGKEPTSGNPGRTPHKKRPPVSKERGYRGETDSRERRRGDEKDGGIKLLRREEQERRGGRGKMEERTADRTIHGGSGDSEKAVKGREAGENVAEQTGDSGDVTRNEGREKELEPPDDRDKGRPTHTSAKKTEPHHKPLDSKDKTVSSRKKPASSRVTSTRPPSSSSKPRGRKTIPTVQSDELAQQLTAGTYECMVCCERVGPRDHVWSCSGCYHVFHLRCIKKWARSPAAGVVVEEGAH